NIRSMNIEAREEIFHCELTVRVGSRRAIDKICRSLHKIEGVKSVKRLS
ncbi:MAG: hypothetical protein K2H76_06335, partial [Muribaculaceae bacterium]|nr:hypothetical protein [Muribaculaceae bacterium]